MPAIRDFRAACRIDAGALRHISRDRRSDGRDGAPEAGPNMLLTMSRRFHSPFLHSLPSPDVFQPAPSDAVTVISRQPLYARWRVPPERRRFQRLYALPPEYRWQRQRAERRYVERSEQWPRASGDERCLARVVFRPEQRRISAIMEDA